MSGIATVSLIPVTLLSDLERVPSSAEFYGQLAAAKTSSIVFGYSGWVLATLLPVLCDSYGIDLMRANPDATMRLSDAAGGSVFVLANEERLRFLDRLDPALFSGEALQRAYEAFNETDADGVGEIMLEGVSFLRGGLEQLTPEHVAVLTIS